MTSLLRPAVVLFVLLTIVTGVLYPLVVTGIGSAVFGDQAMGSIIRHGDAPIGSALIGQDFSAGPDAARYFWGRPSATGPVPYTSFNADKLTGSSGSNLAPSNPALLDNVKSRLAALQAADIAAGVERSTDQKVPVDLVTASGSGLDPHISPAAAEYQVPRVAAARHIDESAIRSIVLQHTSGRQFGLLGEPVVNVLQLNLCSTHRPQHAFHDMFP